MKLLLSAALITFSALSIAEPNKEGHDSYEHTQSGNTATRLPGKVGDWFNDYNEMAKPQAAKQAQTLSQAGSFSTYERANAHAAWLKLNNNGAGTRTESASINGAVRYRVFIDAGCGSFKNQPGCGCMGVSQ